MVTLPRKYRRPRDGRADLAEEANDWRRLPEEVRERLREGVFVTTDELRRMRPDAWQAVLAWQDPLPEESAETLRRLRRSHAGRRSQ
jgi:hypothetical protein